MPLTHPERLLEPVLEQFFWQDQITWRISLAGLIMLGVAASIWLVFGRGQAGTKATAGYWLLCGTGLWLTLNLPIERILTGAAMVIAGISLGFAYGPLVRRRRRIRRGWMRDPELLASPFSVPRGLITSMTAMALLVFFLAMCHVTSAGSAGSALAMGIALLIVVDHRFRPEAAMAGMVLVSLSLVCGVLIACGGGRRAVLTVINLTIPVLAWWGFLWFWLGRVWEQQVVHGRPLTTSARLIGLTRHAGTMALGFATLLFLKLSAWPMLGVVWNRDNDADRLVLLGLAAAALLGANLWVATVRRSDAMGMLFLVNLAATGIGYLVRCPALWHRHVLPHLPLWIVAADLVFLALAMVTRRARWRGLMSSATISATVLGPLALVWAGVFQSHALTARIVAAGAILAVSAWAAVKLTPTGPTPASDENAGEHVRVGQSFFAGGFGEITRSLIRRRRTPPRKRS